MRIDILPIIRVQSAWEIIPGGVLTSWVLVAERVLVLAISA